MRHCGKLDDVYAYEKMRGPPHDEHTPESPSILAKVGRRRALSFREMSPMEVVEAPPSPTSAKVGPKKSASFRWLSRQSNGTPGNSKRVQKDDGKQSHERTASSTPLPPRPRVPSTAATPTPTPTPSRRIGFVDILVGYHSLLQASPALRPPTTMQRNQLYPTIGFLHNPDYPTHTA